MEKVTWELASSIPRPLIDELQAEEQPSKQKNRVLSGRKGMYIHTIHISTSCHGQSVQLHPFDIHYRAFKDCSDESSRLTCTTEKDKGVRLHHRTAGNTTTHFCTFWDVAHLLLYMYYTRCTTWNVAMWHTGTAHSYSQPKARLKCMQHFRSFFIPTAT